MPTNRIQRTASTEFLAGGTIPGQARIAVDDVTGTIKFNPDGTITQLLDNRHDFTIAGALTLSGLASVTTQSLAAGSAAAPSLYFTTESTTGLYRAGANQIGIAVSGAALGKFTSGGLILAAGHAVVPAASTFSFGTGGGATVPGLRLSGGQVQYSNDGSTWTALDAAATVNYWGRSGTVLSPATAGDSLGFTLLAGTDATYDIGASGANRFRDLFLSRNATIGGTLAVSGAFISLSTDVEFRRASANFLELRIGGAAKHYFSDTDFFTPRIVFDLTNQDVNLYRSAANTLKTDDSLVVGGTLAVTGVGNAIGGAYVAGTGLTLAGAATVPAGYAYVYFAPSVTATAGGNATAWQFAPTIVEAGSGTHALLTNVSVEAPTITGAAATVTNAASLYVAGAPTGTVSGANYALWVAAGASKFGGAVTMGSTLDVTGAASAASLATAQSAPTAEGTFKVYCTGTSPSRVCKIAIYDGGAERVIGTMTY